MKITYRLGILLMFCAFSTVTFEIMAEEKTFSANAELANLNELLMIRGVVTPDGGDFFPFYRIPVNDRNLQKAKRSPSTGTHSVKLVDIHGKVMKQIAWTPMFYSEDPEKKTDTVPFSWLVIPKPGVVEVQLEINDRIVTRFKVRKTAPQIDDFQVEFIGDSDDPLAQHANLTWNVVQSEALSNDSQHVLYQVYYSNDNGIKWILVQSGIQQSSIDVDLSKLPGGKQCLLRISTTDGFNSSHRISKRFSVADKPPNCFRIAPRFGRTYREGAGVLLIGRCVDLEDGVVPDESMSWFSNVQGILGHGRKIVSRDLRVGKHKITLNCRDDVGNEGKSSPLVIEVMPK